MTTEATIWGGTATAGVTERSAVPVLQIKMPGEIWTKAWRNWPRARIKNWGVGIAAAGFTSCEVEVKYGPQHKFPHLGTAPALTSPLSMMGWWIRVVLYMPDGSSSTQFVGRIESQHREPYGSATAPAGTQTFIAHDPSFVLSKIMVCESVWWDTRLVLGEPVGMATILGRTPGMNRLDEGGTLLGNRTPERVPDEDGTFMFGGTALWSRAEFIEYVLSHFADEGGVSGPTWSLAGQTAPLQACTDHVAMGSSMSVLEILRRLITPQRGMDFKVVPQILDNKIGGFDIYALALQDREIVFGGEILPANQNPLTLNVNDIGKATRIEVVVSRETRVRKIRVLGEPIVMCCTLWGQIAAIGQPGSVSLVPKWSSSREAEYQAGTGNSDDDAAKHDEARGQERFASVYSRFGAPTNWDHQEGIAVPTLTEWGDLYWPTPSQLYQNQIRATMQGTPLKRDHDYATAELNLNPAIPYPEFLPPMGWIHADTSGRFVRLEDAGIHFVPPYYDWGVLLGFANALPHLIAKNHWSATAKSDTTPTYDYETLVVTLAMRTDHRLKLEYDVPVDVPLADVDPRPTDGSLTIEMPGHELWFMVPGTAYDVAGTGPHAGELKTYQGAQHLTLRNDAEKMHLAMAGAIARHAKSQGRALIEFEGLLNFAVFAGHMLSVIDVGGTLHEVKAPVTSVRCAIPDMSALESSNEAPSPTTTIEAGYVG